MPAEPPERAVAVPQRDQPRAHNAYPNPAGWVCPRCHKVWSPYVRTCLSCNPPPRGQTGQVERR